MALSALIWDFDGTLVQTREASYVVFQKVNDRFRLGVDSPEAFFRLFDRNLFVALGEVCRDEAQKAEVRQHFMELLAREYTPALVPGMASVVRALAGSYTMVVLTTNTMEVVRRVLLSNGLANCFSHVFSGDVFASKEESIGRFLSDPTYSAGRHCSPHYEEGVAPRRYRPDEVMLLSDTVGDVEEALAGGIRVAAVAWGMHSAAELEAAGAEFVCIWPEELVAYLAPGQVCSAGACSLPTAAGGEHVAVSPTPARPGPGEVRRQRRNESARLLAGRLKPAATDGDACCTACAATPSEDPVLRRALERIATPATVVPNR